QQRPPQHHRPFRSPELRIDRIGNEGDRRPAQHQEAHDAEVEQPAIAPLDIEPQRHEGIGEGLHEDQRDVRRAENEAEHDEEGKQPREHQERALHHDEAPLKMPVGRHSSTTTRITKATVSLYSVGTTDRSGGMAKGKASRNGRNNTDQLKMASVSAKPIRKPPAMAP